jgi:hypothetical protein
MRMQSFEIVIETMSERMPSFKAFLLAWSLRKGIVGNLK